MELRDVEMDVERIVGSRQLAAYNDKTGKTVCDYMEDAVHEALAIAGVKAVKPAEPSEAEARPIMSAVELALERGTKPAAEGVA